MKNPRSAFGRAALAALALIAGAVPAIAQEGLPSDFQRTMDDAVRNGASFFASMNVRPNTPMEGLGNALVRDGWRPVTQATMQANRDYPKIPGYVYATEARVDFDGDGRQDLARLVDNGREGGVLIQFADARKPAMVAFRSDRRFGSGEGLFAAGRRLVLNIPEARQHVLFLQNGAPRVHTIGD